MPLFRRARREQASRAPQPRPVDPLAGPTWMPAEEWQQRLAAYRRQGRSDSAISEVARQLERRGPRTPWTKQQQVQHAKSLGIVARAEYLTPEDELHALALGANGFPDAWLEQVRDRLLVVTPSGMVNPKSRTAWRAGLYSFTIRGAGYHEAAARAGNFAPGTSLRLVREPNNPHDANAIAIYADSARNKSGYVPKGLAKRLAPLLDNGADLVALSVRGSGARKDDVTPHVLICEQSLLIHLTRSRD